MVYIPYHYCNGWLITSNDAVEKVWIGLTGWDEVFVTYDTVLLLLLCETVWNKLHADLLLSQIFGKNLMSCLSVNVQLIIHHLIVLGYHFINCFQILNNWRSPLLESSLYSSCPSLNLWTFGAECYRFVMFSVMLKMLNVNYCQWPVMVTQVQSLQSAVDHTGRLCYQRVKLCWRQVFKVELYFTYVHSVKHNLHVTVANFLSLRQNLMFACCSVTTKKNTIFVHGCYRWIDWARTFSLIPGRHNTN